MENQTQTVQQVVQGVIATAGVIALAAAPATFGIVEALKKAGMYTRFIGVISVIVGFLVAILFGKLFTGSFFSTFNIAVGIVVAFGTPGAYSAIKSLKKTEPTE